MFFTCDATCDVSGTAWAGPSLAVLQVLDAGRQNPPLFADGTETLDDAKKKVQEHTANKLDAETRTALEKA